ncbi:MAG: hypothetical protein ACR2M7_04285 [Bdellovibrionales bacterium]
MAVLYNQKPRREKGYSFNGGKISLGSNKPAFGPQNQSPLEASEIIPKDRQEKAQKAFEKETQKQGPENKPEMDQDGNIKMNGANQDPNQQDPNNIDFNKPIDPSSMDKNQIKALQKKIGAGADGKWGPGSQNKLNTYYAFEGIEPPNAKRLQGVLEDMGAVIKEKPDNYDTIGGKKPSYATNELSSGGDVSPELINTIENYMKPLEVPGLRITAGNDAYHQGDRYSRPGQGAHSKGKALDFTTDDPQAVRDALLGQGYKHVETKRKDGSVKYSYYVSPKGKDPKHRILDEYAHATKNTTGGHFDWKVY